LASYRQLPAAPATRGWHSGSKWVCFAAPGFPLKQVYLPESTAVRGQIVRSNGFVSPFLRTSEPEAVSQPALVTGI